MSRRAKKKSCGDIPESLNFKNSELFCPDMDGLSCKSQISSSVRREKSLFLRKQLHCC